MVIFAASVLGVLLTLASQVVDFEVLVRRVDVAWQDVL
jgi:hypothetical protein